MDICINVQYAAIRCLVVTYIVFCVYICSSIHEEGEGGMVTKLSSQIERGLSILEQGHTEKTAENKEHMSSYSLQGVDDLRFRSFELTTMIIQQQHDRQLSDIEDSTVYSSAYIYVHWFYLLCLPPYLGGGWQW